MSYAYINQFSCLYFSNISNLQINTFTLEPDKTDDNIYIAKMKSSNDFITII